MATKIRLTRMGTKHMPFYRIVVADSRQPRDSRFIEVVGHYDPLAEEDRVKIDESIVRKWLDQGAIPTQPVKRLLHQAGLLAKWDEEERAKYRDKRETELRAKAVPLESIKEKIESEAEVEKPEPKAKPAKAKAKPAGKKGVKTTKKAAKTKAEAVKKEAETAEEKTTEKSKTTDKKTTAE